MQKKTARVSFCTHFFPFTIKHPFCDCTESSKIPYFIDSIKKTSIANKKFPYDAVWHKNCSNTPAEHSINIPNVPVLPFFSSNDEKNNRKMEPGILTLPKLMVE
jgi:hypothetical protein